MTITRTKRGLPVYDWEPDAVEKLRVDVQTNTDPTAVTISFAVDAVDDDTPSGYSAGAWSSGFTAHNGMVSATSPTIGQNGSGATLTGVAAGGPHYLRAKWTIGGETIIRKVCQINFP